MTSFLAEIKDAIAIKAEVTITDVNGSIIFPKVEDCIEHESCVELVDDNNVVKIPYHDKVKIKTWRENEINKHLLTDENTGEQIFIEVCA